MTTNRLFWLSEQLPSGGLFLINRDFSRGPNGKHSDTPLDVRIQCAGLLLKQESPAASEHRHVTYMPPALPGDTPAAQMAIWFALYGTETAPADPEWDAAAKVILEKASTRKPAVTL